MIGCYQLKNGDYLYCSVVIEEAAQMLEVETLFPMFLQGVDTLGGPRLKRIVLIGDTQQVEYHFFSLKLVAASNYTPPNCQRAYKF